MKRRGSKRSLALGSAYALALKPANSVSVSHYENFPVASRLVPASLRPAVLAIYAFARAANVRVLCLAHVTNTMGQAGDDFEKGEADGTRDSLAALRAVVGAIS